MIRIVQKAALLAAMALICQGISTAEAQPAARVKVNIEAQGLKQALNKFAEQTGIQILQREEDASAAGLRAPRVVGDLSPREALDRLLADTKLRYEFVNERTVRISAPVSSTSSSGGGQSAIRLTQAADTAATPVVQNTQRAETTQQSQTSTDEMEVTGARIDGLTNKGLLPTDPEAPLYHSVITKEEIDRLGVTTMEDLFRFIPQTSSAETFSQGAVGSELQLQERQPSISLRGLPSSQTTILVNGRPLPRMMHTSSTTSGGADISRIPLAAIERVEILPYAGSAIYGAGAIGGAINIVLRKNFEQRDLTANVGASFGARGSEEYGFTYVQGFNWNEGKTNLTLTASGRHEEPLYHGDRDFLQRAVDRYGPASTARIGTTPTSTTAFEAYILPALSGAPATILLNSATGDLGIPGRPGVRWATVPAGTTAEQSFNLTPASFVGTAGNYTSANGPGRYNRLIIKEPEEQLSLFAMADHEIIPRRLKLYGEFSFTRTAAEYSAAQATSSFTLTAADPMNPFGNARMPGGAGRSVIVYFDTPDVPDADYDRERDSYRVLLGLQGDITKTWSWSLDAVYDHTNNDQLTLTRASGGSGVTGLMSLTPAGNLDFRRGLYPLLSDHNLYPVSSSISDTYFGGGRLTTTEIAQKDLSMKVQGELFTLPAGRMMAALNGRLRNYDRFSGFFNLRQEEYVFVTTGAYPNPLTLSSPITSIRDTRQATVEMIVPIFGRNWHPIPLVEALELNLVHSREENASSGVNQSTQQPFDYPYGDPVKTNVMALKWQLVKDLAFRGSFSEGLYPPDWNDTSDRMGPQPASFLLFSLPELQGYRDPLRGNQTLVDLGNTTIERWNGGNVLLLPEKAETINVGMILKPRFLPGLNITVDYTRTEKTDAISRTSYTGVLERLQDYEAPAVVRNEPSPTDIANGWAGSIHHIATTPYNLSRLKVSSIDARLQYDQEIGEYGNLMFLVSGTYTTEYSQQTTPGTPERDTVSAGGPNKLRGYATLAWDRGPLGVSITGRYLDKFFTNTNLPSVNFPNATGLDGPYIPSSMIYNMAVTYSIGSGQATALPWLLDDSRFKVGIDNLFNEMPSFVSDGRGFYNRGADVPRLRYLKLEYRKNF